MINVSGNSDPNLPGPAGTSGFCETYISATIRVIILKQELTDAHFSKFKRI